MNLMKRLFAVSAVAMAVVAAPVASASAIFQGLTFTFFQVDPNTLTFEVSGTPSGDWLGVQNLGAFALKDLGLNFTTATAIANGPGAVNLPGIRSELSANLCTLIVGPGEKGSVCFDLNPDKPLSSLPFDFLYTIDFTPNLNIASTGVHLKIAFTDANGDKVGSLYSQDVPLEHGSCCQHDVPEPQPLALIGLGLFALLAIRRKFNT